MFKDESCQQLDEYDKLKTAKFENGASPQITGRIRKSQSRKSMMKEQSHKSIRVNSSMRSLAVEEIEK